ncbi:hypothetical protein M408DRAFT_268748 [Serendipita vermifera MAFF 305830]|uniref:TOG domain-containing protein n=1 Tax=Serendipita vermifera MAFF 305830 TaxID=933852 RepID=A0A0C3ASA4_SERVB|nr:hypothetical protein M408DRAFT_268748 [Serendipita vermifera MAFF 305830]
MVTRMCEQRERQQSLASVNMVSGMRTGTGQHLSNIAAELRETIRPAIPQLVECLQYSSILPPLDAIKSLSALAHDDEHRLVAFDCILGRSLLQLSIVKNPALRYSPKDSLPYMNVLARSSRTLLPPKISQVLQALLDRNSNTVYCGMQCLSSLMRFSTRTMSNELTSDMIAMDGLRTSIRAAIQQLVKLLKDGNWEVQRAAAAAVSELGKYAELRDAIRTAISQLVELLKDENREVRRAAAAAVSELGKYAELREAVRAAIPRLVDLLKDGDANVRAAGAAAISEFSKHAELRDAIRPAIPQLVELLKDRDSDVRAAGAAAISELSKDSELRDTIRVAIPQLVELLKHGDSDVQAAGAAAISSLSKDAELRDAIRPAIPQLVESLKHRDSDVRAAGAAAISSLSKDAEHRDAIRPAIPQLVECLQYSSGCAQIDAVKTLSALAHDDEHRLVAFNSILGRSLSQLSVVRDQASRYSPKDSLPYMNMLAQSSRTLISPKVSQVLQALLDRNSNTVYCGMQCLSSLMRFSTRTMSNELTPDMIAMGNPGLTSDIANIPILAHHNGLRTSIGTGMPRLVELLKDGNRQVRRSAAAAVSELGKYAELRDAIRPAIPQLVDC